MPFDQFTVEQLAGDLLPNATLDQRIATGFNRNHRGNSEGGIIPEEYAVEYVVDRVDTTSTVFLGLTTGCARCHNHKYDPITQKEYYQLFAYFNNVPEYGKARRQGNSPPYIKAPTAEQQPKMQQLDAALAAATSPFAKLEPRDGSGADRVGTHPESRRHDRLGTCARPGGALPARRRPRRAGVARAATASRFRSTPQNGQGRFAAGRVGQAATFDGKSYLQSGDIVGFDSYGFYDDKYIDRRMDLSDGGDRRDRHADRRTSFEPNGHGLQPEGREGSVQLRLEVGRRGHPPRDARRRCHSTSGITITLTYDGSRYAEGREGLRRRQRNGSGRSSSTT